MDDQGFRPAASRKPATIVRSVPARMKKTELARGGLRAKMKKYTINGEIWMGTWATGMMLLAWAYLKAIWFCQVMILAVKTRIDRRHAKDEYLDGSAASRQDEQDQCQQRVDPEIRKTGQEAVPQARSITLCGCSSGTHRLRLTGQQEKRPVVKRTIRIWAAWSASSGSDLGGTDAQLTQAKAKDADDHQDDPDDLGRVQVLRG